MLRPPRCWLRLKTFVPFATITIDGVIPKPVSISFHDFRHHTEVRMTTMTAQKFAQKLHVSDVWVRELARAGHIYPESSTR